MNQLGEKFRTKACPWVCREESPGHHPGDHIGKSWKGFHADSLSQVGAVLIETQHFRGKKKKRGEGE